MTADVHAAVRTIWEGRAPDYDVKGHETTTPDQDAAWRALLGGWAGPEPLDIVDVGCGTGFLSLRLAAHGHHVVGVDAADAMRALAAEKAARAGVRVDLRPGDALRLPVQDASADLVVERHVIWTVADPAAALRDWARVLRPGGRLVLVEGEWGPECSSAEAYAPLVPDLPLFGGRPAGDMVALVTDAGYDDVTVEELDVEALWGGPREGTRYAVHARRP